MKVFSLALKFFKQHKLSNILVILQIVFSLFLFTLLMNRTISITHDSNFFNNPLIKNSLYYMGHMGEYNNGSIIIEDYHSQLINKLKPFNNNILGISTIGEFLSEEGRLFVYDKITAQMIGLPFDYTIKDKQQIINYHSDSKHKKTLSVDLFNQYITRKEYETSHSLDTKHVKKIISIDKTITLKKLPEFVLYAGLFKTNGLFDLKSLKAQFSQNDKESTIHFMLYDSDNFKEFQFPTDSFFVYLKEGVSPEPIQDILNEYGVSFTGNQLLGMLNQKTHDQFTYDLYIFLSVAILAIISLFSVTFLNLKRLMKQISIYYINGCSFLKSLHIYFVYLMIICFGSLISFLILLCLYNWYKQIAYTSLIAESYLFQFNWKSQIISMSMVFVIIIVISFIPFLLVARKSKVQMLKELIK